MESQGPDIPGGGLPSVVVRHPGESLAQMTSGRWVSLLVVAGSLNSTGSTSITTNIYIEDREGGGQAGTIPLRCSQFSLLRYSAYRMWKRSRKPAGLATVTNEPNMLLQYWPDRAIELKAERESVQSVLGD